MQKGKGGQYLDNLSGRHICVTPTSNIKRNTVFAIMRGAYLLLTGSHDGSGLFLLSKEMQF